MEQQYELRATKRDITGKQVKTVRKQGFLPANLYGKGIENVSLSLPTAESVKLFANAGTSALVNLSIEGETKPRKVLFHDPQLHPVSGKPIHLDMFQVNMKEKIRTEVPLEFTGESTAVIDLEGNLITSKDAVEVECLPDDLISEITVDISVLKTFEDSIRISDLKVPEGIEILDDPEEMIAMVTEPRSEEELEADLASDTAAEAESAVVEELNKDADAEPEEDKAKE